MKRFFVVSLLAIVSLFTNFTLLRAEVEGTNSVPTLQLCFTGVPSAVFQINYPINTTVDLSDGPTSVLAENYVNIGGALFSFSVSSTDSYFPITRVLIVTTNFREEIIIDDDKTSGDPYQVLIPLLGTSGTQLVYISALSN